MTNKFINVIYALYNLKTD